MLYAFPADRTGCGFYRVIWPLSELRGTVPLEIVMPGDDAPLNAEIARDKAGKPYVTGVVIPDDCTAVLLQRPTSVLLVQCIPFLKAREIKVIVEVDDDLHALTPRHAAYKSYNSAPSASPFDPVPLHNSLAALMQACELADLVICSTPALVDRYAPGTGRGIVLRNRLRSDFRSCLEGGAVPVRADPPHTAPRVSRVGWAGVIGTHPDDLAVLGRALPRTDVKEFYIVGPAPREDGDPSGGEGGVGRAQRLLGLPSGKVFFTGSVTFADFLPTLKHSLDIGLAPLEDNRFNQSKSWLKPLEYAACGIPCIASETEEYALLGASLLATDHKSWAWQLRTLLGSPTLREDLIATGYEIADRNTYAKHSDEWHSALAPLVS